MYNTFIIDSSQVRNNIQLHKNISILLTIKTSNKGRAKKNVSKKYISCR